MSVTPDVDKAARLGSSLALRIMAFDSIEGRALPAAATGAPTANVEWTLEPPMVAWHQVDRVICVVLPFEINVSAGGERCYQMRVSLRATYDLVADAPIPAKSDVDHYAGISSVLQAWPYLRAELQTLSTKLGMVAPVVLPNITAAQLPDVVEVKRGKASGGKKKAR